MYTSKGRDLYRPDTDTGSSSEASAHANGPSFLGGYWASFSGEPRRATNDAAECDPQRRQA